MRGRAVTTSRSAGDTPEERLSAFVTACGGMTRESGGETICRCPAHDDENPSLNVRLADNGNLLIKCRANCTNERIVAAIDWKLRDLMASQQPKARRANKTRDKKVYGSLEAVSYTHLTLPTSDLV